MDTEFSDVFLRSFDRRLATVLLSREKFPNEEEIRPRFSFFFSSSSLKDSCAPRSRRVEKADVHVSTQSTGQTIGQSIDMTRLRRVPCSEVFLADRTRLDETIPRGCEHVVARDTTPSATRCSETRRRGTKTSELIVLRPTELVVGDEAVLVLVLVLKNLLDQLVVVNQHLLHLFVVAGSALLRLDHLFPQVLAHLYTNKHVSIER